MKTNKRLICKMIQKSMIQYNHEPASIPLNDEEYDRLADMVLKALKETPALDLHEIIEDIVYDYLTS